MVPTDFPESNMVISGPPGSDPDDIVPINACHCTYPDGQPLIVTCWKLTKEEVEELLRTGRIYVGHLGNILQPHWIDVNSPFGRTDAKNVDS